MSEFAELIPGDDQEGELAFEVQQFGFVVVGRDVVATTGLYTEALTKLDWTHLYQ